ncbi:MAG: energy transducer TonB [Syntrophales bacterium]|nr:energy transducer TonB [Syntrophales bacterium]
MTSPRIGKGRDNNRISLNNMIFLSLLLHALALSAILFSPTLPSPRWTFGPIYSVQLVSLSEDLLKEKSTSAISRELMETDLRDRPIILKKRIDTTATGLTRSIEIQKKQTGSSERAIEDIRQRVLSLSNPQDRATPPVVAEGTVASLTQQGDAELSMKMKAYYAIIWERIKGQWVLPPDILSGKNIGAVIHLRILRNGTVTDVNFEKRSGNRYFDESTMKAIEKASPFPPLPEQLRDNSIEVGIRFHSSEMR